MIRAAPLGTLISSLLLAAACAKPAPPAAEAPLDWAAVAGERVPRLVTRDPDGAERVTKIWLAILDGEGYIRTSSSRWFANIERDPDVVLRVGGRAHPLRVEHVNDPALEARVHQAFRAKYGLEDRLVYLVRGDAVNVMRLVERGP